MKFAIIYRPKHPPPPDAMPELLSAMGEWMQTYGSKAEALHFFVGGGGFGMFDTDDAGELTAMISSHPFTPYAEVEVKAVLDPAAAMAVLQDTFS